MKKKIDKSYKNKYTGDRVIKRGYAIYDEWSTHGFSSRKIVKLVERAVAYAKADRRFSSRIEALALLFALDLRVQEKYNTLLKCLFSYFAWRRETKALKRLQSFFHIKQGADLRSAIEIEIKRLREAIDMDKADGKDGTRGGKQNGKSEAEAIQTEEKELEQASEDEAGEIADAEEMEEASEEAEQELSEQASADEMAQEHDAKQQDAATAQEDAVPEAQQEAEQQSTEERNAIREESNGADAKAEPSQYRSTGASAYNDAVDSPPLYETKQDHTQRSDSTSASNGASNGDRSKGREEIVYYDPLKDQRKESDVPNGDDTVERRKEESKKADRDAYLYDRVMRDRMENDFQMEEQPSEQSMKENKQTKQSPKENKQTKQSPKESKQQKTSIKDSKPTETSPKENKTSDPAKQDKEAMREPLHVDITQNHIIWNLTNNISADSVEAFKSYQMELMREQMRIESEAYGVDNTVEPPKTQNTGSITSPTVGPNRK